MNSLLTSFTDTLRTSREAQARIGFEDRYPAVVLLLKQEQVGYWVESGPASEGRALSLVLHRPGCEYEHLVALSDQGTAVAYGKPVEEEALLGNVRNELGRWSRWDAARTWRRRMVGWEAGRVLGKAGVAALALALVVLIIGNLEPLGLSVGQLLAGLVGLGSLWAGCARVLVHSRRQHFPHGMEEFVLAYPAFEVD